MNSVYTIKRASYFKRFIAFICDFGIAFFLFVGIENLVVHPIVNHIYDYDTLQKQYEEKMIEHGCAKYDKDNKFIYIFDEKGLIDYTEFDKDKDAVIIRNNKDRLDIFSMTADYLLSEFLVFCLMPLILKNGQTIGKKLTKLALVSTNEVKVKGWNVFARWAIGIFAFETIINMYFSMFFFIPLISIASIIMMLVSKKGMCLHDHIGGTIVVDLNNTIIVDNVEERTKRILEEREEFERISQYKSVSSRDVERENM